MIDISLVGLIKDDLKLSEGVQFDVKIGDLHVA